MFSNVQLWMLWVVACLVWGYFWYMQHLRNLERQALAYLRNTAFNLISIAQQQPIDSNTLEPQMQMNQASTAEFDRIRTIRESWERKKWWVLGAAGVMLGLVVLART